MKGLGKMAKAELASTVWSRSRVQPPSAWLRLFAGFRSSKNRSRVSPVYPSYQKTSTCKVLIKSELQCVTCYVLIASWFMFLFSKFSKMSILEAEM